MTGSDFGRSVCKVEMIMGLGGQPGAEGGICALRWRGPCPPRYGEPVSCPGRQLRMFGRVEQAIDRNVVICLAVVAAVLLLTGLVIAVASPAARAHRGTAQPG